MFGTLMTTLLILTTAYMAEAGTGLYMGPYFKDPQPLNFTVHTNNVAYLPCAVRQLGDKKVAWVRVKDADSDILTVGQYTFVNDERFSVFLAAETWTLVIKFAQARDAGVYECQISSEPKMALMFRLNVIVPQVEIIGEAEKYVRKGSTAKLECRVSSTVQLPDYIFWYHEGQRLLEYNEPRMTISVSRASGDKDKKGEMSVTSVLVLQQARLQDAGSYTCLPSNLPNSTIRLHVLDGEHPAAMQTGSASLMPLSATSLLFATFIVLTLSSAYDFDATQTRLQIDEGKNRKQDKSHHQSASYETISTDHSLHQCSHDKNTMISNAVIPGRDGEVEMQSRVTGENSIRVSKILEHSSVTACNTAWADVGCWKIESGIHKPAIFIGITADEEAVSFNRNSPVICVAESSPLYCSS